MKICGGKLASLCGLLGNSLLFLAFAGVWKAVGNVLVEWRLEHEMFRSHDITTQSSVLFLFIVEKQSFGKKKINFPKNNLLKMTRVLSSSLNVYFGYL